MGQKEESPAKGRERQERLCLGRWGGLIVLGWDYPIGQQFAVSGAGDGFIEGFPEAIGEDGIKGGMVHDRRADDDFSFGVEFAIFDAGLLAFGSFEGEAAIAGDKFLFLEALDTGLS
jgi:hypothetical protein